MHKPRFLERSGETYGGRSRVIAAGAGGLAVGAVIGAGVVLGVQYVMRGFMGIPGERATPAHPYGEPLRPEDAAFPVAGAAGAEAASPAEAAGPERTRPASEA